MGASIYVHWPGCTSEDEGEHPGFDQDDHAYATWIETVHSQRELRSAMQNAGLNALLAIGGYGQRESAMVYASPEAVIDAALRLKSALAASESYAHALVTHYRHGPGVEEPAVELSIDLDNVVAIAAYASNCGARQMTLLIGW